MYIGSNRRYLMPGTDSLRLGSEGSLEAVAHHMESSGLCRGSLAVAQQQERMGCMHSVILRWDIIQHKEWSYFEYIV